MAAGSGILAITSFFARHGPFGPGSRWHIVEAFGAERRFLLDQVFDVTRLGDTGFTMEIRSATCRRR